MKVSGKVGGGEEDVTRQKSGIWKDTHLFKPPWIKTDVLETESVNQEPKIIENLGKRQATK